MYFRIFIEFINHNFHLISSLHQLAQTTEKEEKQCFTFAEKEGILRHIV